MVAQPLIIPVTEFFNGDSGGYDRAGGFDIVVVQNRFHFPAGNNYVVTLVAKVFAVFDGNVPGQILSYGNVMYILVIKRMVSKYYGYVIAAGIMQSYSAHGKRGLNMDNIQIKSFEQIIHPRENGQSQGIVWIGRGRDRIVAVYPVFILVIARIAGSKNVNIMSQSFKFFPECADGSDNTAGVWLEAIRKNSYFHCGCPPLYCQQYAFFPML